MSQVFLWTKQLKKVNIRPWIKVSWIFYMQHFSAPWWQPPVLELGWCFGPFLLPPKTPVQVQQAKQVKKASQHQWPHWCSCIFYLCKQLFRFVLPDTTLLLNLLCITIPLFLQLGYRFQQLQHKNISGMIKTALADCDNLAPTHVDTWWLFISSCCFSSSSNWACWLALVGSDWLEH